MAIFVAMGPEVEFFQLWFSCRACPLLKEVVCSQHMNSRSELVNLVTVDLKWRFAQLYFASRIRPSRSMVIPFCFRSRNGFTLMFPSR